MPASHRRHDRDDASSETNARILIAGGVSALKRTADATEGSAPSVALEDRVARGEFTASDRGANIKGTVRKMRLDHRQLRRVLVS